MAHSASIRRGSPAWRLLRHARRGVAAMEFAIVAPAMVTMVWGVYDITRALIAWEETYHAAEAIAQAATKLSYAPGVYYPNGGGPLTSLTAQQMQNAMTTIYAEMPGLDLGKGDGSLPGNYAVTLSGVAFTPLCPANGTNTCATQSPVVLWSANLDASLGGAKLLLPTTGDPTLLQRQCGPLTAQSQFPNSNKQLSVMIDPNMSTAGGAVANLNLIPQVVADVQYTFTPTFPLLSGYSYTFWASATFPAPLGGDDQEIVYNSTNSATFTTDVTACAGGNAF